VVPALAVADALVTRGAEVLFIGGARAERELVPSAGYRFEQLSLSALDRRNPLRALRALVRAARAVGHARRLLRDEGIDVVVGGGGYVAGPIALAAWTRRIPFVLTEADSHLGLANRLLAPLAARICLALPIDGRGGRRYQVTGRPVPAVVTDRDGARSALGIQPGEQCVLVFGGSLGSRTINEAALDGLDGASFHVLHVTGVRDWPALRARPRGPRYDLREYLDRDAFGQALAACDLVVARAGGSIFEIAANGRPAVLIPYPAASADHQRTNAAWMERAGAAVVIEDRECTGPRLASEVGSLIGDRARLAAMGRASRSLAHPDAAAAVADIVLAAR
jgi:UDP-N-acetylglucosamine--N-acetylmuramyl-(pentapeptide) pyrophosphoryl-undecaprenol N-acetylglucosamine transferase